MTADDPAAVLTPEPICAAISPPPEPAPELDNAPELVSLPSTNSGTMARSKARAAQPTIIDPVSRPRRANKSKTVDEEISANQRKMEDKRLSQARQFLFTTDARHLPPKVGNGDDRTPFWERSDVLERLAKRKTIEVPGIKQRKQEELAQERMEAMEYIGTSTLPDTSDGSYLQRHKRFKFFEKKQWSQEHEKLKHTHYALKERRKQLDGVESSHFAQPGDTTKLAEKRRRAFIRAANDLDEQYTATLSERKPDRRRPENVAGGGGQAQAGRVRRATSVPPQMQTDDFRVGTGTKAQRHKRGTTPGLSLADDSDTWTPPMQRKRSRAKTPGLEHNPTTKRARQRAQSVVLSSRTNQNLAVDDNNEVDELEDDMDDDAGEWSYSYGPKRGGTKRKATGAPSGGLPNKKRQRAGTVGPGTIAVEPQAPRGPPGLLVYALRSNHTGERGTKRLVTPFGVVPHPKLFDTVDFSMPLWLRDGWETTSASKNAERFSGQTSGGRRGIEEEDVAYANYDTDLEYPQADGLSTEASKILIEEAAKDFIPSSMECDDTDQSSNGSGSDRPLADALAARQVHGSASLDTDVSVDVDPDR
ncbi:hypothetical protein BKA62DRAFT_295514 [Auriculariales sp. MPI-PUGE-AT-0066]|nr:hypothetical protein BKA62DRAFT_295514 [Auriculariales sp. MPI-PUGE-AT-0066]